SRPRWELTERNSILARPWAGGACLPGPILCSLSWVPHLSGTRQDSVWNLGVILSWASITSRRATHFTRCALLKPGPICFVPVRCWKARPLTSTVFQEIFTFSGARARSNRSSTKASEMVTEVVRATIRMATYELEPFFEPHLQ